MVRAARVYAGHRDPGALAGGVSGTGAAAVGPDREGSEHPVAGEAGVQAAVGGRVVGEAAGQGGPGVVAGPVGGSAVLVRRAGAATPPQRWATGRRGGARRRPDERAGAVGGAAGRAGDAVAGAVAGRGGGAVPGAVPVQGLRAAQ